MSFSREVKDELSAKYPKSKAARQMESLAKEYFAGKIHFTQDQKNSNIITDGNSEKPAARKAVLKGAFISAGSISDPEKGYHLEIICDTEEDAGLLQKIIESFGITAHITDRAGKHVVYIKDGDDISDFLRCVGASASLMKFENVRILREMRGSVNRQVNCETANINKSVKAAGKQIEDIRLIEENLGFEKLDDNLREICRLRLENPEVSLEELGRLLTPPLGKSGVNHRLRKISSIADKFRRNDL